MKQAWQSVASVARSTMPCEHRPELERRGDEVDHPVQGAVLLAEPAGPRQLVADQTDCLPVRYVRSAHPSPANGCPRAIVLTPAAAGYTSQHGYLHRASRRRRRPGLRRGRRPADRPDREIEFLFAQFVDMHGKPSAKLVPAHHIDDLLTEGAGFAGFAAGDIGQGPHDPDLIAMPDPEDAHDPPLAAERRAIRLRRDGRGRAVAVLPADDPAQHRWRAAQELGFELKMGAELEYFLVRRREDGSIEVADKLDTLDLPCYDMRALTRNLDFVSAGLAGGDRARVGQLRHRPRGRQRAVRAELPVRRRAHHLRPRCVLPLHGRVAGPAARA